MDASRLRVVVSGPVGTGKSTLVRALAKRFGLPVIEEGMAGVIQAETRFRKARGTPGATREQLAPLHARAVQEFRKWFDDRAGAYARHPGFVADRWEADVLDYWLVMMAQRSDERVTAGLLAQFRQQAAGLTAMVHLPMERVDPQAPGRNEDGIQRNTGLAITVMNWVVTPGLVRQFTDLPVIRIPAGTRSPADREALVVAALEDLLAARD